MKSILVRLSNECDTHSVFSYIILTTVHGVTNKTGVPEQSQKQIMHENENTFVFVRNKHTFKTMINLVIVTICGYFSFKGTAA